jgi:hypothetical protein
VIAPRELEIDRARGRVREMGALGRRNSGAAGARPCLSTSW